MLLIAFLPFAISCEDSDDTISTSGNPDGNPGGNSGGTSTGDDCINGNDLSQVPDVFKTAITKFTTTNAEYLVQVCTEDTDSDGTADWIVVTSTNQPEHESVYWESGHKHFEDYDYDTNEHKFEAVHDDQQSHSAGNNKIESQTIVLKMPIAPAEATTKTETSFATIGLALNGVSFFNENAAPGDEITDELFTFDQCSGHPQQQGVYHYHVDPVCLIRDLGGSVTEESKTADGTTYQWLVDDGTNADLLLGFLMDGFPVYGPVGTQEKDCNDADASSIAMDEYNGHSHCTAEFADPIYHYHVKTAVTGGQSTPVFWITNKHFYGEPGSVSL